MPSPYILEKAEGHPRATSRGFVAQHVLVVERAIGHHLRLDAEVHHVDCDGRNNAPTNLVACQDRAYHQFLHVRMRARDECGNPDWRKCTYCKHYDRPDQLKSKQSGGTGRSFYHNVCAAKYQRDLKARRVAA